MVPTPLNRVDSNALTLPELYAHLAGSGLITRLLELARDEDLGPPGALLGGSGDITSAACFPATNAHGVASSPSVSPSVSPRVSPRVNARIVARRPGVIAGLAAIPETLRLFPGSLEADVIVADGASVQAGQTLATISGAREHVLVVERTLLNLIGRLSGIATRTAMFAAAIPAGLPARLLDTRKTTPGLRVLEKYAVRCGGGLCHRLGLHDAVLIKDNHIAGLTIAELGPWVASAAERGRNLRPDLAFVEVEVDSLEQLRAILHTQREATPAQRVDFVLLDNMDPTTMAAAVAMRSELTPRILLEASGGVTLDSIAAIARSGVDRISVGGLTHSAVQLDVAMDL
jgi:nicotinate-nucleotide pyrophosphorylase (carboxylating)